MIIEVDLQLVFTIILFTIGILILLFTDYNNDNAQLLAIIMIIVSFILALNY